jgi:diaminopimelate decarboxylase
MRAMTTSFNPDIVDTALDEALIQAAQEFGTPTYVYVTSRIEERAVAIRAAFRGTFELSFAVKSNPNPGLLKWLHHCVRLLDVSSIGEFRLALRSGWQPEQISFTGPAKRPFELKEAIAGRVGELVLESVDEARMASQIAGEQGVEQAVLVRIAPDRVPKGFGDQMAGRPGAFGIDQEQMLDEVGEILRLPHLRCEGFHIYSGTQSLKAEAICENYRNFMAIFREVCSHFQLAPRKLIFGSGLGVPYHEGDAPLDLELVGQGIRAELEAFKAESRFSATQLVLELGRHLVAEAGFFLTRVVRVKDSRGSRIAICDGGLNNHLAASGHFGMVIHRNYRMHKLGGFGEPGKVDIVGPLCTSIDKLARGAVLPHVVKDDVIAVHTSGAYGLTASPIYFISHPVPREVLVTARGQEDVTRDFHDYQGAAGGTV